MRSHYLFFFHDSFLKYESADNIPCPVRKINPQSPKNGLDPFCFPADELSSATAKTLLLEYPTVTVRSRICPK